MNIKGKLITLRAIEYEDLDFMRSMLNDQEIEDQVVGWSFPVSRYMQNKWFEGQLENKDNMRFIIEYDKTPIGLATLHSIDWKNRVAVHGIKIAKRENRGKSVGTDTVMSIMRYAFDELGLHRLEASWLSTNPVSPALFKKCGWTFEGIKRECVYKNARYIDLAFAGITDEEYRKAINKTRYWDC